MAIELAPNFHIPDDAATRRMAILAMSGAGKSNVAVVMAEGMFKAGIPWVAIDPKGDWWGVRSNKRGTGPGLPIPIFGGLHGDVPLDPRSGRIIADLVIDQRLTCVIDVSEFPDRQGMWFFLTEFGDTLLKRNREVLHLFLEEADEYLPQKTSEKGNLPKCLGVWQRLVKRGRFRGIGTTQISQRSAAINKDTLYQAEVMIAMRVTGKGDRDAIGGWVEHYNAASDIVESLPTLGDGEGWVTSPAWLKETQRVKFNRRHTFDSGSTPVLLEGHSKPATLADVDLVALQGKMAAVIEKEKQDDPVRLRAEIRSLKAQLASKEPAPPTYPDRSEQVNGLLSHCRNVAKMLRDRQELMDRQERAVEKFLTEMRSDFNGIIEAASKFEDTPAFVHKTHGVTVKVDLSKTIGYEDLKTKPPSRYPPLERNGDATQVKAGARRILAALVQWYPNGMLPGQVRSHAAMKKSGTYDGYISNLYKAGYITKAGGMLYATEVGRDYMGGEAEAAPTTTEEVLAVWAPKLKEGARKMILALVERGEMSKDDLAAAVGLARSGTFDGYLSNLRTAGLIETVSGVVKPKAETLFL